MDNKGLTQASGAAPVVLVCACCSKSQVYIPSDSRCFDCTVKSIAESMGYTDKKLRLRRWREMAYQLIVMYSMMGVVNHYLGMGVSLISMGAFMLGNIIEPITKILARKF